MKNILIRIAEEKDIEKLKALTDRMLAHTGLGVATTEKIRALVKSPRSLVLLAFDSEELVGYTCGILHESVFNDRLRVSDIGVYVDSEYRSGSLAKRLIDQLESWSKKQGAKELWLGQTTGDNPDQVVKYYNRLGYTTKGFNCVKEL
jgi:GNAT superfamily N-acetyltransferase